MTIIAGFRVQDGILLCSDTEWSGGLKIYKEKIFTHPFRGGVISFAVSGDERTPTLTRVSSKGNKLRRDRRVTDPIRSLHRIVGGRSVGVTHLNLKMEAEFPRSELLGARGGKSVSCRLILSLFRILRTPPELVQRAAARRASTSPRIGGPHIRRGLDCRRTRLILDSASPLHPAWRGIDRAARRGGSRCRRAPEIQIVHTGRSSGQNRTAG